MIEATEPVEAVAFDNAGRHERNALAAYHTAAARADAATTALSAVQCGVEFVVVYGELPDDPTEWADSDYCEDHLRCARPTDHPLPHKHHPDRSEHAPAAYTAALAQCEDAQAEAQAALTRWHAAEDALDALRCGYEAPGEWPCILRRGHPADVPHEHAAEISLMPTPH
jgi:hypothetical protein